MRVEIPTLRSLAALAGATVLLTAAGASAADDGGAGGHLVIGAKLRAGGRYDNVRMCVATDPGVEGGPAADISLFAEIPLSETAGLEVDLPVFRPIFFAAAFEMLQFEPSATLKFRTLGDGSVDLVSGPVLGASLHYGPDYRSGPSGRERRESFFAVGPTIGGYIGLDFKRPGQVFNFQLGLTPYLTLLMGLDDPSNHNGVVIGGLLDGSFRFDVSGSQ